MSEKFIIEIWPDKDDYNRVQTEIITGIDSLIERVANLVSNNYKFAVWTIGKCLYDMS